MLNVRVDHAIDIRLGNASSRHLNRDLGYLPGDAEEKMSPYMQPLFDYLNFIKGSFGEHKR